MAQHPFQNFMVTRKAGEKIFAEGDPGATMYVVHSGVVRLSREVDGQLRSLGELEKGDFFGEMSILEGLPRTVGAEAVEESQLIEINSTIFDKMIRGNIEIAVRMLRKLSIRLREAELKVSELQASGARCSQQSGSPALSPRPADTATRTGVRLEAQNGEQVYCLAGDETLVGRYDPVTELKPDVDLTDLDLKRSVSRRHARITRAEGGGFVVNEEVGALHGTTVNGTALVPGQAHPLADGDALTLGNVTLIFRAEADPGAANDS